MYNDRTSIIRNVVMTTVIIMTIIVALAIYFYITQADTKKVTIVVAPKDSEVSIDGRKVSGEYVRLSSGEHSYLISRGDFRSEAGIVTVSEDGEQYISASLEPINDTGRKYASTIPDQYSVVSTAAGDEASEKGKRFTGQNPIIAKLPFNSPLFTIGYKSEASDPNGNAIIITIRASSVYRENALTQIENWGFNPADYNIEFINERNPFL